MRTFNLAILATFWLFSLQAQQQASIGDAPLWEETELGNPISTKTSTPITWPDCVSPNQIEVEILSHEECLFQWVGDPAAFDGTRYQVHYKIKEEGQEIYQKSEMIYKGSNCLVSNLSPQSSIQFSIRTVCDGEGEEFSYAGNWNHFIVEDGQVRSTGPIPINPCDAISTTIKHYASGTRVCWSIDQNMQRLISRDHSIICLPEDPIDCRDERICNWDCQSLTNYDPMAMISQKSYCVWMPSEVDSLSLEPALIDKRGNIVSCPLTPISIQPPNSICDLNTSIQGVQLQDGQIRLYFQGIDQSLVHNIIQQNEINWLRIAVIYYDTRVGRNKWKSFNFTDPLEQINVDHWYGSLPSTADITQPIKVRLIYEINGKRFWCPAFIEISTSVVDTSNELFCGLFQDLNTTQLDINSWILQFDPTATSNWQNIIQSQQIGNVSFTISYNAWNECEGSYTNTITIPSTNFDVENWAVVLTDLVHGIQTVNILVSYDQANIRKFCFWPLQINNASAFSNETQWQKSATTDCDSLENPLSHFCDLMEYLKLTWTDPGEEFALYFEQISQADFESVVQESLFYELNLNVYFSQSTDIDLGIPEQILSIPLNSTMDIRDWGAMIQNILPGTEIITLEMEAVFYTADGRKVSCGNTISVPIINNDPNNQNVFCELVEHIDISHLGQSGAAIFMSGLDEAYLDELVNTGIFGSIQLSVQYWDTISNASQTLDFDWAADDNILELANWSTILYHFDPAIDIQVQLTAFDLQYAQLCLMSTSFSMDQIEDDEVPNLDATCEVVEFVSADYNSGGVDLYFGGISINDLLSLLDENDIANFNLQVDYVQSNSGLLQSETIQIVSNGQVLHNDILIRSLQDVDLSFPINISSTGSNSDQSISCTSSRSISLQDDIDNDPGSDPNVNSVDDPNIDHACALAGFFFGESADAQNVRLYIAGITLAQFNTIIQDNEVDQLQLSITYWDATLDQEVVQLINLVDNGLILHSADWEHELQSVDLSVDIQIQLQASNEENTQSCSNTQIFSLDDLTNEEDIPLLDELPLLECGSENAAAPITNIFPLQNLSPGDLITIADFPVLIKTVQGTTGVYSGTGIIRIPFGNKAVSVSFDNIQINELYQVFAGEITGVSDNPENYPDFSLDTLSIGGDICITSAEPGMNTEGVYPVTGLDAYGFNPETGIHPSTGTEYDENGFDINGIHRDTGNEYNLENCNRDNIDIFGNPCDPSGNGSPQVTSFIDSVSTTIPSQVTDCVDAALNALQDTLAQLTALCGSLRTEMQDHVNTLEYSEAYIFGEQQQFFNEGMHHQFEEEPQILQIETPERLQDALLLESKHVELYHCDHGKLKVEALIDIVNSYTGEELTELILAILEEEATTYLVEHVFSDPDKFKDWIRKKIAELIASEYESLYNEDIGFYQPSPVIEPQKEADQTAYNYSSSALFGSLALHSMNQSMMTNETILYQLGAQEIRGVHRAFYIQELSRQKRLAMLPGGEPTDYEELLPVEISREVAGKDLSIFLDQLRINPDGALINAYFMIEDPGSGKRVVFEAQDIHFTASGLSAPAKLSLLTTIEIRLNNSAKLILNANEQTYVRWDCDGFHSMQVDMSVEFCREFIKPVDPNTKEVLPDPERVRVNLVMEMFDWLDFTKTVNVPAFALNKHEEMVWTVMQATIDMSDQATPAVTLLPGYESPHKTGNGLAPAWKGFYLADLSVCLPRAFKNSDQNVSVGVQDVLIDGCGVSGEVYAQNVIPIESGNAGGWAFSVEDFSLLVLHNHLAGGIFSGEINVPIFKENFDYTASLFPNNTYSFEVSPQENMTIDLWLAKAKICQNSSIILQYADGDFFVRATLNGHLDIVPENDQIPIDINFPQLKFNGLQISNKSPYFSAGIWDFDVNSSSLLKGFNCGLKELTPFSNDSEEAGLAINLDVLLAPAQMINATGSFQIIGNLETNNGIQKWVFDRVEIGSLYVNASFPGAHIEGGLDPYDEDPVFGEGFRGSLSVNFDFLPTRLSAIGQFGKVNDFKYFLVDALADVNVPIGGGLQFKGFGGGIYYKMAANSETTLNVVGEASTLPALGESLSGVIYNPDITRGIGFKGLAVIATAQESMFNGTVSLDVSFNDASNNNGVGGLAEIALRGTGKFLTPVQFDIPALFDSLAMKENTELPGPSIEARLSAYIDIGYNFNQNSFDGLLAVYLDAGVLRGIGPHGRLCRADLHFGPDNWYIWMGKPDPREDRCGAVMDIGILEAELTAYFNVGSKIPPFPQIQDPHLKDIADRLRMPESLRGNMSQAGIMFGADFNIGVNATVAGTGAVINAGAGFDLMLRKFEEAICVQTGEQIGIDGWYAIGQVWTYLEAQIKFLGIKIFGAGIAAALQARGPNPFYAHALLRIRACALFFCKTFNIDLELGDDCVLSSNDPNDEIGIRIISHLDPLGGTVEFPVENSLFAYFTLSLDKYYEMQNLQGDEVRFRAKLAYARVSSNDVDLSGSTSYFNNNRALKFEPLNMLPARDTILFEVAVDIFKDGEYLLTEIDSSYFVTTGGYDHIPEANVEFSYPYNGMYNFHKKEYNQYEGYIQLKSGQPDLFFDYPEGMINKIRLSRSNGETHVFDFEYDALKTSLEFPLDPHILNAEEVYKLEIVLLDENNVVPYIEGSGDNNTGPMHQTASMGDVVGLNTDDVTRESGGEEENNINDPDSPQEKVLYTSFFRVSKFDRFANKFNAIMDTPNLPGGGVTINGHTLNVNFTLIGKNIDEIEPISNTEFLGNHILDKLITFKTSTNNSWYQTIYPLIYENYPISAQYCSHDIPFNNDPNYESIEASSIRLTHTRGLEGISEDNFWGVVDNIPEQTVIYQAALVARNHYVEQKMATAMCLSQIETEYQDAQNGLEDYLPQELIDFMETEFRDLFTGFYEVNVSYNIPGKGVSSNFNITFENP